MKISKICALILALAMVLPFAVSCGSAQDGTPISFPNVIIINTLDPNASEPAEEAETAEEAAEAGEEDLDFDFEETVYSGEVVVYAETETSEITVLDVIQAYADAKNENLVYDEARNRITKIGEISAGGGYFWNYLVNEKDAKLGTPVTPEDEIQIIFMK